MRPPFPCSWRTTCSWRTSLARDSARAARGGSLRKMAGSSRRGSATGVSLDSQGISPPPLPPALMACALHLEAAVAHSQWQLRAKHRLNRGVLPCGVLREYRTCRRTSSPAHSRGRTLRTLCFRPGASFAPLAACPCGHHKCHKICIPDDSQSHRRYKA